MDTSEASQGQRGALTFSREPRNERGDGPGATTPAGARRPPMALTWPLILIVVSDVVINLRVSFALASREGFDDDLRELLARWNMIGPAVLVALTALAAAGAFELVRRTSERSRHGARLILGGLLALVALSFLSHYLFTSIEARPDLDYAESLRRWIRQLRATSWNVITLGALLAGWRERRVRLLAVPLIIVSLLSNAYDFYGQALYSIFDGRWALYIQSTSLDAAYVAVLVLVLHLGAPLVETAGGWARAAVALDRTASALYARLWISAASITLVMLSYNSDGSSSLAKLWMLGVPLGVAVANLVAVSGLFSAAALTAPEAPRRSLHAAATLLMMATFLSAMQMFRLFHNWPNIGEGAKALPVAMPVIAGLAQCALAEGLVRLAALLPSLEVAQQAINSRMIVILSQLAMVGLQYYMTASPPREPSSFVLMLVLSVGVWIVVLVSQARLCRALAAQIRERNELPAATVVAS